MDNSRLNHIVKYASISMDEENKIIEIHDEGGEGSLALEVMVIIWK